MFQVDFEPSHGEARKGWAKALVPAPLLDPEKIYKFGPNLALPGLLLDGGLSRELYVYHETWPANTVTSGPIEENEAPLPWDDFREHPTLAGRASELLPTIPGHTINWLQPEQIFRNVACWQLYMKGVTSGGAIQVHAWYTFFALDPVVHVEGYSTYTSLTDPRWALPPIQLRWPSELRAQHDQAFNPCQPWDASAPPEMWFGFGCTFRLRLTYLEFGPMCEIIGICPADVWRPFGLGPYKVPPLARVDDENWSQRWPANQWIGAAGAERPLAQPFGAGGAGNRWCFGRLSGGSALYRSPEKLRALMASNFIEAQRGTLWHHPDGSLVTHLTNPGIVIHLSWPHKTGSDYLGKPRDGDWMDARLTPRGQDIQHYEYSQAMLCYLLTGSPVIKRALDCQVERILQTGIQTQPDDMAHSQSARGWGREIATICELISVSKDGPSKSALEHRLQETSDRLFNGLKSIQARNAPTGPGIGLDATYDPSDQRPGWIGSFSDGIGQEAALMLHQFRPQVLAPHREVAIAWARSLIRQAWYRETDGSFGAHYAVGIDKARPGYELAVDYRNSGDLEAILAGMVRQGNSAVYHLTASACASTFLLDVLPAGDPDRADIEALRAQMEGYGTNYAWSWLG